MLILLPEAIKCQVRYLILTFDPSSSFTNDKHVFLVCTNVMIQFFFFFTSDLFTCLSLNLNEQLSFVVSVYNFNK